VISSLAKFKRYISKLNLKTGPRQVTKGKYKSGTNFQLQLIWAASNQAFRLVVLLFPLFAPLLSFLWLSPFLSSPQVGERLPQNKVSNKIPSRRKANLNGRIIQLQSTIVFQILLIYPNPHIPGALNATDAARARGGVVVDESLPSSPSSSSSRFLFCELVDDGGEVVGEETATGVAGPTEDSGVVVGLSEAIAADSIEESSRV